MDDEYDVKYSPLCQYISSGGSSVRVQIFEDGYGGWLMEVEDEFDISTVWDDTFTTDIAALTEIKKLS